MTAITLPVGSLIFFDTSSNSTPSWQKVTEHNRQPMSLQSSRIEKALRMSNGSLRKFFVADKANLSVAWNIVPSFSNMTVDGGYGAMDIKSFYEGIGKGSFKVKIVYGKNQTSPYADRTEGAVGYLNMVFTSANFEVVKRNVKNTTSDPAQEFWNVSIALEEV